MKRRPDARSVVIVAGAVVVAAYLGLAVWSARISPLARGPLLDGGAPVNYLWVSPPPELASSNEQPLTGRGSLPIDPKDGSGAGFVSTRDGTGGAGGQAVVLINQGSIRPADGQRSVEVVLEPLDPARFPDLGGGRIPFGNAYRITATYQPSGQPVRTLDSDVQVTLVYPQIPGVHTRSHELLHLRGGTGGGWKRLPTTDLLAYQQAQAVSDQLGVFLVGGVPSPLPSVAPEEGGGSSALVIALVVLAGCVLLVGVGLLLRSRGPKEA